MFQTLYKNKIKQDGSDEHFAPGEEKKYPMTLT